MTTNPLKVESVKIDSLTPDPANARAHDERNMAAIKSSLEKFGQRKPLVVTADDIVLAGNGTLAAAKELGWTHIYVHRTPAEWEYEQARAYSLADNRTAELASWVPDVLQEHLVDLDAAGFELSDLGFESLTPPSDPEMIERFKEYGDDIPTEHRCPKCGYEWSGSSK